MSDISTAIDFSVTSEANQDCLAKARPGEPMFIILGRDPDGATIVRQWADRRSAAGDPDHASPVYAIADAMAAYAADPANVANSAPAANQYRALTTRLAPDRNERAREAVWRSIDTAPEWVPVVVSDGSEVALSARSRTDGGYWYWAVEPEDALWFEPTMWTDAPSECPTALTPATAPDRTPLETAARELLACMSSTYRARNGREMGIEADDGEKCYIVHSDLIHALEGALAPDLGLLINPRDMPVGVCLGCSRTATLATGYCSSCLHESRATAQDREAIARIIDPAPFEPAIDFSDDDMNARHADALTKADAILSLMGEG